MKSHIIVLDVVDYELLNNLIPLRPVKFAGKHQKVIEFQKNQLSISLMNGFKRLENKRFYHGSFNVVNKKIGKY